VLAQPALKALVIRSERDGYLAAIAYAIDDQKRC